MDNLPELWKRSGYIKSVTNLQKYLKSVGESYSRDELTSFLSSLEVNQIHAPPQPRLNGHIVAHRPFQLVQADLLDYSKFKATNKGFSWIMIIIDVFTRRSFAAPMKNKTGKEALDTLFNLLTEMDKVPEVFMSDKGREFVNNGINGLLEANSIRRVATEVGDHKALGIVDRFSRTLRSKLETHFAMTGSVNWVDILPDIIEAYNSTPHRGINDRTPISIEAGDEEITQLNNEKEDSMVQYRIRVGDTVRSVIQRNTFAKGSKQRYTKGVFKVVQLLKVNAILDDGRKVRIENLALVRSDPTEKIGQNVPRAEAELEASLKPKGKYEIDVRGVNESQPRATRPSATAAKARLANIQ